MCGNVECKTYSLARLPKHEECSPAIQVFEFFHCQIYSGYHSLVQCQYLKQFLFFVFAESADEGFETWPYFMTENFLVKSSYNLENTTGTSSNLRFLMSCPFADWVGLCQRTRAAFALSVGDSLSKRVSLVFTLAKVKTIHDQRWSHFQPNFEGLLLKRLAQTPIV